MQEQSKKTVTLLPFGLRMEHREGDTVLKTILRAGIKILSICGGAGTCGRCIIELVSGELVPHKEETKFVKPPDKDGKNRFFACTVRPAGDCTIRVPEYSIDDNLMTQTDHTAGSLSKAVGKRVIKTFRVKLQPPDLGDIRSDADRLIDAVSAKYGIQIGTIDFTAVIKLSSLLRENEWEAAGALYRDEIVHICSPSESMLILAVDIGTTKCAVYLLDSETGGLIDASGVINPQTSYGADVVSRLGNVVSDPELKSVLQRLVIEEIIKQARELCEKHGVSVDNIVFSLYVGNTAMHHLFFGFEVEQLINSPYVPAISAEYEIKHREIGLSFGPGGYAHWLPNIAGYVGGDHLGVLLAMDAGHELNNTIYIDIGTNTEMSLAAEGTLYTVSAPSGPAFEGAHIEYGMRAIPGAIDTFRIRRGGSFEFTTIGGRRPMGICGSGILDIMSELFRAGYIDWRGRLKEGKTITIVPRNKSASGDDIILTQKDIREFQLAKGAITAGILILLKSAGIRVHDIHEVIIAGAFGSFINAENAREIGLFPFPADVPIRQAGNAAGAGACKAAADAEAVTTVNNLKQKVKYIELVNAPDFKRVFARATYLGNSAIDDKKTK